MTKTKDAVLTRQAMKEELDAANSYETKAARTSDPSARRTYKDISNEEKVHVGELQEVLDRQDPYGRKARAEGRREAAAIRKSARASRARARAEARASRTSFKKGRIDQYVRNQVPSTPMETDEVVLRDGDNPNSAGGPDSWVGNNKGAYQWKNKTKRALGYGYDPREEKGNIGRKVVDKKGNLDKRILALQEEQERFRGERSEGVGETTEDEHRRGKFAQVDEDREYKEQQKVQTDFVDIDSMKSVYKLCLESLKTAWGESGVEGEPTVESVIEDRKQARLGRLHDSQKLYNILYPQLQKKLPKMPRARLSIVAMAFTDAALQELQSQYDATKGHRNVDIEEVKKQAIANLSKGEWTKDVEGLLSDSTPYDFGNDFTMLPDLLAKAVAYEKDMPMSVNDYDKYHRLFGSQNGALLSYALGLCIQYGVEDSDVDPKPAVIRALLTYGEDLWPSNVYKEREAESYADAVLSLFNAMKKYSGLPQKRAEEAKAEAEAAEAERAARDEAQQAAREASKENPELSGPSVNPNDVLNVGGKAHRKMDWVTTLNELAKTTQSIFRGYYENASEDDNELSYMTDRYGSYQGYIDVAKEEDRSGRMGLPAWQRAHMADQGYVPINFMRNNTNQYYRWEMQVAIAQKVKVDGEEKWLIQRPVRPLKGGPVTKWKNTVLDIDDPHVLQQETEIDGIMYPPGTVVRDETDENGMSVRSPLLIDTIPTSSYNVEPSDMTALMTAGMKGLKEMKGMEGVEDADVYMAEVFDRMLRAATGKAGNKGVLHGAVGPDNAPAGESERNADIGAKVSAIMMAMFASGWRYDFEAEAEELRRVNGENEKLKAKGKKGTKKVDSAVDRNTGLYDKFWISTDESGGTVTLADVKATGGTIFRMGADAHAARHNGTGEVVVETNSERPSQVMNRMHAILAFEKMNGFWDPVKEQSEARNMWSIKRDPWHHGIITSATVLMTREQLDQAIDLVAHNSARFHRSKFSDDQGRAEHRASIAKDPELFEVGEEVDGLIKVKLGGKAIFHMNEAMDRHAREVSASTIAPFTKAVVYQNDELKGQVRYRTDEFATGISVAGQVGNYVDHIVDKFANDVRANSGDKYATSEDAVHRMYVGARAALFMDLGMDEEEAMDRAEERYQLKLKSGLNGNAPTTADELLSSDVIDSIKADLTRDVSQILVSDDDAARLSVIHTLAGVTESMIDRASETSAEISKGRKEMMRLEEEAFAAQTTHELNVEKARGQKNPSKSELQFQAYMKEFSNTIRQCSTALFKSRDTAKQEVTKYDEQRSKLDSYIGHDPLVNYLRGLYEIDERNGPFGRKKESRPDYLDNDNAKGILGELFEDSMDALEDRFGDCLRWHKYLLRAAKNWTPSDKKAFANYLNVKTIERAVMRMREFDGLSDDYSPVTMDEIKDLYRRLSREFTNEEKGVIKKYQENSQQKQRLKSSDVRTASQAHHEQLTGESPPDERLLMNDPNKKLYDEYNFKRSIDLENLRKTLLPRDTMAALDRLNRGGKADRKGDKLLLNLFKIDDLQMVSTKAGDKSANITGGVTATSATMDGLINAIPKMERSHIADYVETEGTSYGLLERYPFWKKYAEARNEEYKLKNHSSSNVLEKRGGLYENVEVGRDENRKKVFVNYADVGARKADVEALGKVQGENGETIDIRKAQSGAAKLLNAARERVRDIRAAVVKEHPETEYAFRMYDERDALEDLKKEQRGRTKFRFGKPIGKMPPMPEPEGMPAEADMPSMDELMKMDPSELSDGKLAGALSLLKFVMNGTMSTANIHPGEKRSDNHLTEADIKKVIPDYEYGDLRALTMIDERHHDMLNDRLDQLTAEWGKRPMHMPGKPEEPEPKKFIVDARDLPEGFDAQKIYNSIPEALSPYEIQVVESYLTGIRDSGEPDRNFTVAVKTKNKDGVETEGEGHPGKGAVEKRLKAIRRIKHEQLIPDLKRLRMQLPHDLNYTDVFYKDPLMMTPADLRIVEAYLSDYEQEPVYEASLSFDALEKEHGIQGEGGRDYAFKPSLKFTNGQIRNRLQELRTAMGYRGIRSLEDFEKGKVDQQTTQLNPRNRPEYLLPSEQGLFSPLRGVRNQSVGDEYRRELVENLEQTVLKSLEKEWEVEVEKPASEFVPPFMGPHTRPEDLTKEQKRRYDKEMADRKASLAKKFNDKHKSDDMHELMMKTLDTDAIDFKRLASDGKGGRVPPEQFAEYLKSIYGKHMDLLVEDGPKFGIGVPLSALRDISPDAYKRFMVEAGVASNEEEADSPDFTGGNLLLDVRSPSMRKAFIGFMSRAGDDVYALDMPNSYLAMLTRIADIAVESEDDPPYHEVARFIGHLGDVSRIMRNNFGFGGPLTSAKMWSKAGYTDDEIEAAAGPGIATPEESNLYARKSAYWYLMRYVSLEEFERRRKPVTHDRRSRGFDKPSEERVRDLARVPFSLLFGRAMIMGEEKEFLSKYLEFAKDAEAFGVPLEPFKLDSKSDIELRNEAVKILKEGRREAGKRIRNKQMLLPRFRGFYEDTPSIFMDVLNGTIYNQKTNRWRRYYEMKYPEETEEGAKKIREKSIADQRKAEAENAESKYYEDHPELKEGQEKAKQLAEEKKEFNDRAHAEADAKDKSLNNKKETILEKPFMHAGPAAPDPVKFYSDDQISEHPDTPRAKHTFNAIADLGKWLDDNHKEEPAEAPETVATQLEAPGGAENPEVKKSARSFEALLEKQRQKRMNAYHGIRE